MSSVDLIRNSVIIATSQSTWSSLKFVERNCESNICQQFLHFGSYIHKLLILMYWIWLEIKDLNSEIRNSNQYKL